MDTTTPDAEIGSTEHELSMEIAVEKDRSEAPTEADLTAAAAGFSETVGFTIHIPTMGTSQKDTGYT